MTDEPDAAAPAAPVQRDHGPEVTFEVLLGWRIQSRTAEPDNARVPSDLAVGPSA